MTRKIVVGSRESTLAVVQSNMLIDYLRSAHPELEISLLTMKTTGDKILDRTLDKVGGKGLFVKELDLALREHRADLTVHSLKDMPMEVSKELPLLCFSKREDPRDVLVLPEGKTGIEPGAPIGSSSLRRVLQMLTSGELGQRFDDLVASLTTNRFGVADAYMTIADFNDYARAQQDVARVYADRDRFNRMSLVNIAKSGIFSADRSVQEYVDNIWKL